LVTGRNRLIIMAASGFYQNEMNQRRVGLQHILPPRASFPLWELRFGGGYGISCAVLPTWCRSSLNLSSVL
jgi:hypothetical protein